MTANLSERFQTAMARFDAAHGEDPQVIDGVASQLLYAQRMTDWLGRLYPEASEALRLAARSQHIRRWKIPRSSYPMTRGGYHKWRTALYSFHADTAAGILVECGYDEPTIARVRSLLRKEKLKTDPEMQALEDVICLVFLEYELADFAPRHEEEKVIGILRRTWGKMSGHGHAAALALPLSPALGLLIKKALGSSNSGDPAVK
jgi:Domain of unknown function (DUF4202)